MPATLTGSWWTYSWALADFRRNGDSPEARKRLQKAFEVNSHVPAYLLGRKRIPGRLSGYIGFGDESEAFSYAAENLEAWNKTPGAPAWLGSVLGDSRSSRGTRRRAR